MDGPSHRASILATAVALAAILTSCAGADRTVETDPPARTPPRERVPETPVELPGTVVRDRHFVLESQTRVMVSAPDSATGRAAIDAAFDAADSVETLLALHRPTSELARINAAAGTGPVPVSPWMEAVLVQALLWASRSGGAYEPTIGPVVDLWGFGRSEPRVPTEAALAEARRLVGWQKVVHDPAAHTIELTLPGMELDLRGAWKGFALDRMQDAMVAAGATSGIVDLDGDMIFFGPAAGRRADRWPIALPDPYDPDSPYARFELPPGSVSTSAGLDRTAVIAGQRYGHLIDPRTGRPVVGGLASASGYAPDGVTSDILAVALYVLGPVEGLRLVERWPGIEGAFVTEPEPGQRSTVVLSDGMEQWKVQVVPPYRPSRAEDDRVDPAENE